MRENCRWTIWWLEVLSGVSCSSIHCILYNLGMSRVTAKSAPRLLFNQRKERRIEKCYEITDTDFFSKIIKRDEFWCYTYDPLIKQQPIHWKMPFLALPSKRFVKWSPFVFSTSKTLYTRNSFQLVRPATISFTWGFSSWFHNNLRWKRPEM